MKKNIITILVLLVCAVAFAAPTMSELFPTLTEAQIQSLLSGETIQALTTKGQQTATIAPAGSQGAELAAGADAITDGFAVAGLSYIPYPERFKEMTEEERNVEVYNIIRSISTQKGITYVSHMAGDKPVVLFEDSYMISNPNKTNSKIADPVSSSVPNKYSCFAYQKDNRFGKNVYKIIYTYKENDFLMDISNYTAMKYMGFSCLKEGELHMYMEVLEADEGFVLYTMVIVEGRKPKVKVLFITVDLPSAFMRRTTALKNWFEMRVNQ